MKPVTGLRNGGGIARISQTTRAPGAAAFVVPAAAAEPAAASAPVTIAGLIGVQDEQAPFRQHTRARKLGETTLAALSALQMATLSGLAPDIEQLRIAADALGDTTDPVLRAIRLRARIEVVRAEKDMTNR